MPLMPNGNFKAFETIEAEATTSRNIGNHILRIANDRGIKSGPAIDQAHALIAEAEKLEEFLQ